MSTMAIIVVISEGSSPDHCVFSRLGKPTDNAFIESFSGKFRAECLNAHRLMSLARVRGPRYFGRAPDVDQVPVTVRDFCVRALVVTR
jgi:transposase InsO family protein